MEFQIDTIDFDYFYKFFSGAENLRNALHKYQFFGFCRKFLCVFLSKRFEKVPTEEILRIYDHFNFTENYESLRDSELVNDISEFIIGIKIPNKNANIIEKKMYIQELKAYFKRFEEKPSFKTKLAFSIEDDVFNRLLNLYSRNLKMIEMISSEEKNTRPFLLNIIHAIMKMEEPNNYPESCLWHEEVRNKKITNVFLTKFYARALDKIILIEKQINQFKKTNKKNIKR